ncbi:TPA: hypothetical protein ACHSMM_004495 [Yersinia enterocolitica]
MMKPLLTLLPVCLLAGCALLPGQGGDYDRFCNLSGTANAGEVYRVADWQDFWLTPRGTYLSVAEYARNDDSLAQLGLLVQGADPKAERAKAVEVRVFKVESTTASKGSCLPVRYSDPDKDRKFSTLTKGRRLAVYAENAGQSGQQIYHQTGTAGFAYRLL